MLQHNPDFYCPLTSARGRRSLLWVLLDAPAAGFPLSQRWVASPPQKTAHRLCVIRWVPSDTGLNVLVMLPLNFPFVMPWVHLLSLAHVVIPHRPTDFNRQGEPSLRVEQLGPLFNMLIFLWHLRPMHYMKTSLCVSRSTYCIFVSPTCLICRLLGFARQNVTYELQYTRTALKKQFSSRCLSA